MYCQKCGNQLGEGAKFCRACGAKLNTAQASVTSAQPSAKTPAQPVNTLDDPNRFLPSFILGLIGSVLGIFGGLCTTACASIASSSKGNAAFILIFGGAIVGLVGACICMKKVRKGSIVELVGSVMMMIAAFGITGADAMSVIGLLLLLVGGLIGLIYSLRKRT